MTMTPPLPRTGVAALDAATDEFIDAVTEFLVCEVAHLLLVEPALTQNDPYRRLMNAATWLDAERERHAAAALFGQSANYDDDQIADMLKGICG